MLSGAGSDGKPGTTSWQGDARETATSPPRPSYWTGGYVLIVLPGQVITTLTRVQAGRRGSHLGLLLGFSTVAAVGWRTESEPGSVSLHIRKEDSHKSQ